MFVPSYFVEQDYKDSTAMKKESDKYYDYVNHLSFFPKNRLRKLYELKRNIIYNIEKESSWKYISHSFQNKVDFYYDTKTYDIKYSVDIVKSNKEEYSSNSIDGNKFCNKYKNLLERLVYIENKIEEIYSKYSSVVEENKKKDVVDFTKARFDLLSDSKKERDKMNEFIRMQARYFYENYHLEGIRRLVNLLNDLTYEDEMVVYNKLKNENISNLYISDLVTWASSYSYKGQKLLDRLQKEREERKVYLESPIPYDVDDKIIKFHF